MSFKCCELEGNDDKQGLKQPNNFRGAEST